MYMVGLCLVAISNHLNPDIQPGPSWLASSGPSMTRAMPVFYTTYLYTTVSTYIHTCTVMYFWNTATPLAPIQNRCRILTGIQFELRLYTTTLNNQMHRSQTRIVYLHKDGPLHLEILLCEELGIPCIHLKLANYTSLGWSTKVPCGTVLGLLRATTNGDRGAAC